VKVRQGLSHRRISESGTGDGALRLSHRSLLLLHEQRNQRDRHADEKRCHQGDEQGDSSFTAARYHAMPPWYARNEKHSLV